MPTIAPKVERKLFELVKAGTHVGIPYQIIHLGTQKGVFNGEEKTAYKIRISFELPNSKKVFKDGESEKPMVVSSKVTLSMFSKAKLRPLVEGIMGITLPDDVADTFDVEDILGKPCLVSIKHDKTKEGKEFAMIASASPLIEGMPVPTQTNQNKVINLFASMGGKWDDEAYKALPDFIKKDIDASLERSTPVKAKAQKEADDFDANTIEYPEADAEAIPF